MTFGCDIERKVGKGYRFLREMGIINNDSINGITLYERNDLG